MCLANLSEVHVIEHEELVQVEIIGIVFAFDRIEMVVLNGEVHPFFECIAQATRKELLHVIGFKSAGKIAHIIELIDARYKLIAFCLKEFHPEQEVKPGE